MDMSRTIATTGQDWANHLSHAVSGNGMTYLVATLSREPDVALLRQAVEDAIDLQPVLGCRFDETAEPPVWIHVRSDDCLRVIRADNLRQGLNNVTQATSTQGRAVQATLICASDQTALCLGFDHAATDGSGAVKCLALLSRCCRERLNGNKLTKTLFLDRSDQQLYARCGLTDYRMALKRENPAPGSFATVPYAGVDGQEIHYLWESLPLSAVRKLGGTVNDCLLAAYALALSNVCGERQRISLHMTVDLRRFLGQAETPLAANLSGMGAIHLRIDSQATFSDILAEVTEQSTLLKTQHIGLSSAAMMTYLRTLPYEKAKCALINSGIKTRESCEAAPILSNLGRAFPETIALGDTVVTNIIALLPALHAPAFMLGAIGYTDVLTLSAGVYGEERSVKDTQRLLRGIRNILLGESAQRPDGATV